MTPTEIRNAVCALQAQGHSLREISRSLALSRNTVRRILRQPNRTADEAAPCDEATLARLKTTFARARGNVVRVQELLADDGLALIEQLGVTDYDLAGYSLGGRTVARMLARGATPRRAIVAGQGLEAILHTEGRGGRLRHILNNFGTFTPGSPEQAMEDFITASGGDPAALVRVLDTFVDTPREALAAVTVPTLVLTGADDGHNETAAALASTLQRGRYVMLPGDHLTVASSPQFEIAVIAFLADREPIGERRG